ncbi:TonB-dependent receptor domain-containing protein [Novosphingobium panipatense]
MRWEYAKESTILRPIGAPATQPTDLKNEYFLPGATLTWELQPGMQARLNASKTIARPQFRELLYQPYFDPDTNRSYQGNPFLTDSKLTNVEGRLEWYFAPEQRFAVGAFWKKIDKPIESYLTGSEAFITSYANAPEATLYGAEAEVQKYLYLDSMGGSFFENRRLVLIGNYTFTKSKLKVGADDTVRVYGAGTGTSLASDYFRDGAPLTGQSEHIANVQIGMEDTQNLSQQTILLNYASKRAVSRGLANTGQPDIFEYPGLTIDVVIRQGIMIGDKQIELKAEGRNLTGRGHYEYQKFADGKVHYNTYDVGRMFSLSAAITF